ncbi:MAG: ABC transporter permease [Roseburia sp.]|nr:ABC transporter permease [Roseburia sp.]
MRIFDLLLMSASNLWKRKLRTVLTVLGVVIGVTSIVVMVALGNGLKESMLESYSSYSSMTQIQVYSNSGGYYAVSSSGGGQTQTEDKYLSDDLIEQIMQMEHVVSVEPRLNVSVIAKSGKYMSYMDLCGVTQETLKSLDLPVEEGTLPQPDGELKLFYGNNVLVNFYIEKTGVHPYWENNEAPNIDLMNDPMFIIFDTDSYWGSGGGSDGTPVTPPKKYLIEACGIMEGELGEWKNESQSVFCDMDALRAQLKKVFKKGVIPGQPTQKNGKPYNELFYSEMVVQVDEMENVTAITEAINDMGYRAYDDAEWIQSNMEQMNTVQAVLGAIGAVAMLVAAISITNTMMMSIYERTKEIGVMKVLGCDIRNIQVLFLTEAGFIGFIGGVIGVGLSYGLGIVINTMIASSDMGLTSVCRIPLWLVPVAILFAIFIGMLAGFFPSLRAMRLSPLAAIRNE